MADRRGVRSSSRRTTPVPQPTIKTVSPKAGRPTRKRGTRSASRDIELPLEPTKPSRRSLRQTSVDSAISEGGLEKENAPGAKHRAQKESIGGLTVVDELDTQLAIEDGPVTPPRVAEVSLSIRSPGAMSTMSGTTAISSFTMVEADKLQPRFMLRHLPKLYQETKEFGEHIVPQTGSVPDDDIRMQEMLKPDSDFVADYNDLNSQLMSRIGHYRGEHQHYIHLRAVHAALFGPGRDIAGAQTGLDLVLYYTNLIMLAKRMIHSDRHDKDMERMIRELDNAFPALFLPALVPDHNAVNLITGESTLLQETFELALELRTQLAILCLERGTSDSSFDPDAALEEVFFRLHPSDTNSSNLVRGWGVTALGGGDTVLSEAFENKVVNRLKEIRSCFQTDEGSITGGDSIDIEGLSLRNPWKAVVLRLLGWVRSRSQELQAAIQQQGGESSILEKVKNEIDNPSSAPVASPRKKRMSFGRERRRSSRKFDPNAEVNVEVLNKLLARERGASTTDQQAATQDEPQNGAAEPQVEPAAVVLPHSQDDWLPPPDNEKDQIIESLQQQDGNTEAGSTTAEQAPVSSLPPQLTGDFVKLVKPTHASDKENRMSYFERQENAQRVAFGDGFSSQATPGPSRKGEEPLPPRSKKRSHDVAGLSDGGSDDEDAFQALAPSVNVEKQRAKAKRVRIDPARSSVPTSHQPRASLEDAGMTIQNAEPSVEREAIEPPEEQRPPRSTYQEQRELALTNSLHNPNRKPRRPRANWSEEEEEEFAEYMADYPRQYATILSEDQKNRKLLQQRTQVDLKDKARVMAKNMVKSGTGIRPGFEGVLTGQIAIQLANDGYTW